MKVVIGSWALNYAGINFRKAKDYDIWISKKEYHIDNIDSHVAPIEIIQLVPVFPNTNIATPDAIYTIKCSHMGWDIFWEKHKQDIIYLKSQGCKLIPELYYTLVKHWETVHNDKNHLRLNKTKKEFFNDHVKYVYDHDLLHEIVARPNRPVYELVLKEGQQVLVDKEKFFKLPKDLQIRLFREEIKTIALERFLIPSGFRISELKAYLLALKKTITNLTKNWATLFIVENLYEFNHMGDTVWYKNFKNHIGENNMSRPEVIEKVKTKAEELEISEYTLQEFLIDGHGSWHLTNGEGEIKKFAEFLEELKFKFLQQEGGGEGGTEYCESVIELEDQAYLLSYSYYSHNGYDIHDLWNWKPVTPKTKTVIYYE